MPAPGLVRPGLLRAPLLLVAFWLSGCPGTPDESRACAGNDDCSGLVPCVDRRCTPACVEDADCAGSPSGKRCVFGGCTDLPYDGPFLVAFTAPATVDEGQLVILDAKETRYVGPGTLRAGWRLLPHDCDPESSCGAAAPQPLDRLRATFTAPRVVRDETLRFELHLSDGTFETSAVHIMGVREALNEPPRIDRIRVLVGGKTIDPAEQSVLESKEVQLDARSAGDPNPGDTIRFQWTQTEGPEVKLGDLGGARPGSLVQLVAPAVEAPRTLRWRLDLQDGRGGKASAEVKLTVRDLSSQPCTTVADCVTDASCVAVDCVGGQCLESVHPWCCDANRTCDDGDPCTTDTCDPTLGCQRVPIPGCCHGAEDCPDPGVCRKALCSEDGLCSESWAEGCCLRDADCARPDPCTEVLCVAGACEPRPVAGCCAADADCDDGKLCTADTCDPVARTCRSQAIPDCCEAGAGCADTSACIADTCDLATRTCLHTPVQGCCATGADCDDGNPCTYETCAGGTCVIHAVEDCCRIHADCPAPTPCTQGYCLENGCVLSTVPGCCSDAALDGAPGGACDDRQPCTADICDEAARRCRHIPLETCCGSDTDCDDGLLCTADRCEPATGRCLSLPIAGCCVTEGDCDDGNPCTLDACAGGSCDHLAIAGCCTNNAACAGDGDPCTADICDPGTQSCHVPIAGCCHLDSDCPEAEDPCRVVRCDRITSTCVQDAIPGCCAGDAACPSAGACVLVDCVDGGCTFRDLAGCCEAAADCDDGNPCTTDRCDPGEGRCAHETISGCCRDRADCPKAGPCGVSTCDLGAHTCSESAIPGCCDDTSDCDDRKPCTKDRCVAGRCVFDRIGGCCETVDRCVPVGACDQMRCSNALCARDLAPGCCTTDTDCDDGDPCTRDACDLRSLRCHHLTEPGCCDEEADCDDGRGCTTDRCEEGECVHEPGPPGCCDGPLDCRDGDPCTADLCIPESGACVQVALPSCCGDDSSCAPAIGSCDRTYCDALRRACTLASELGCCQTAADCPPPPPCAEAACVSGGCALDATPSCCTTDADCDDGNPCTADGCSAGSCTHGAAAPGSACDDGEDTTRGDLCGVSGRCAGFRAWSVATGPGLARRMVLDPLLGLGAATLGTSDFPIAVAFFASVGPHPHGSATISGAALVDAAGGDLLGADGRVWRLDATTEALLEVPSLSASLGGLAAPYTAIAAVPGDVPGSQTLLVGGRSPQLWRCASPGPGSAFTCQAEALPDTVSVLDLAAGGGSAPSGWAIVRGGSGATRILARSDLLGDPVWGSDLTAGCPEGKPPCAGLDLVAIAASASRPRALALGRQSALDWSDGGGWAQADPPLSGLAPAAELRALALSGDRVLVAGIQVLCEKGEGDPDCPVQRRRWWLAVGDLGAPTGGPLWAAPLLVFEEVCGPPLGADCSATRDSAGPWGVSIDARDTWRVSGVAVGPSGFGQPILLWRR